MTAPLSTAVVTSADAATCPAPADGRAAYRGRTLLGRGIGLSTDSHETGLNNNLLVLGPSGAGKTRGVLLPNLLELGPSYVVFDTKGALLGQVGPYLASQGYAVEHLNFADLEGLGRSLGAPGTAVGYNPLAHVRIDPATGLPNQQDIITAARALCPIENNSDPFWDIAAANYLAALISYVLEELPADEQHLGSVETLLSGMGDGATDALFQELDETRPQSFAAQLYRRTRATSRAEKMHASILGIAAEKMLPLAFSGTLALYRAQEQVDFCRLGREKRALFIQMSDIDRSLAGLTSLFVEQLFHGLIRFADSQGGTLPVPVRVFLDDFANLYVPGIDDVLSVARSRELWIALIAQSATQLTARYGRDAAMSIIANCDTQLVLAYQDADTAEVYASRANRLPSSLMATPAEHAWLFIRGREAREVSKLDPAEHPAYQAASRALQADEQSRIVTGDPCWVDDCDAPPFDCADLEGYLDETL